MWWVFGFGCWFRSVVELSPAVLEEMNPPLTLLCLCLFYFPSSLHPQIYFLLRYIQKILFSNFFFFLKIKQYMYWSEEIKKDSVALLTRPGLMFRL